MAAVNASLTMPHPGAADKDLDVDAHLLVHPDEDYYYGFEDSEAMETLLDRNPHRKCVFR